MTEEREELVGISRATFDWIITYLRERPYGEVRTLMDELEQNTRIIRVEVPEKTPEEKTPDE